jgi:restriction system protein
MARRKKSSPADDLIELSAMLPWWAGVALALLSYLLLHQIAAQPLTASAQPGPVGNMPVHRRGCQLRQWA